MNQDRRRDVDPTRKPDNPFDHDEGMWGQSYSREREEALRRGDPSGAMNADPASAADGPGARASIDPASGEPRGSGAGTAAAPDLKPDSTTPESR